MSNYYTALQSRSHALLLERRMKEEGIRCEIAYLPREIMVELCSLGVKFDHREYPHASRVIQCSGLPGCRLYQEVMEKGFFRYQEVPIWDENPQGQRH